MWVVIWCEACRIAFQCQWDWCWGGGKLSYGEPNCHVCNGNADQSKPMAQPVKAEVLQPFLRCWKRSGRGKHSTDHNASRKPALLKLLSQAARIRPHCVFEGARCLTGEKSDVFLIRCGRGMAKQFLTQDVAKWMNAAFCSTADQYAGETCLQSILKGYCVTSVLVFSSLMEYRWCVESVSPPKLQWLDLSRSAKYTRWYP